MMSIYAVPLTLRISPVRPSPLAVGHPPPSPLYQRPSPSSAVASPSPYPSPSYQRQSPYYPVTASSANAAYKRPFRRKVTAYVDGSCTLDKEPRCGAGVFVEDNDVYNKYVPVPLSRRKGVAANDSLRAELYAAMLGLHVLWLEKRFDSRSHIFVIKQDSLASITLLRHCTFGACEDLLRSSPSRWLLSPWPPHPHPEDTNEDKKLAAAQQTGQTSAAERHFRSSLPWGQELTGETVLDHADILDTWWWYTRGDVEVQLVWTRGHQENPTTGQQSDHEVVVDEAKQKQLDWNGNRWADVYAKAALEEGPTDNKFRGLPLFPRPVHDWRSDCLPWGSQPLNLFQRQLRTLAGAADREPGGR